jgi:Zn-dependent protease with chaperone function
MPYDSAAMATTSRPYPINRPVAAVDRPAATAAVRLSRAGIVIAVLGLVGTALVIARLLESWRVTPHAASHHVTILGQRLSYPSANVDAIVVLALAVCALFAIALGARRAASEIVGTIRLRRTLAERLVGRRDGALLLDEAEPLAFCLGFLRPRVYVSTGAVDLLDDRALEAVLAHERHHAARRDPLRFAAARVLEETLFYIPGVGRLARRQHALAELSADEFAAAGPGGRSALALAMLAFDDASTRGSIEPERVDHLLGKPVSWRLPLLACLVAVGGAGLLVAVAVLAGRLASGTATLAPPFLSSQPCVLALAAIPVAAALVVLARRRSRD